MWRDPSSQQQLQCANKGYVRKRRKHTDTQEGHNKVMDRLKPGDQVKRVCMAHVRMCVCMYICLCEILVQALAQEYMVT